MPAFFWRSKCAVLQGGGPPAPGDFGRLPASLSMNEFREWVDRLHRGKIYRDRALMPAPDPGLVQAVEERVMEFFEVQGARGIKSMPDENPQRLVDCSPAPALP
jgi:hypothetical protein